MRGKSMRLLNYMGHYLQFPNQSFRLYSKGLQKAGFPREADTRSYTSGTSFSTEKAEMNWSEAKVVSPQDLCSTPSASWSPLETFLVPQNQPEYFSSKGIALLYIQQNEHLLYWSFLHKHLWRTLWRGPSCHWELRHSSTPKPLPRS